MKTAHAESTPFWMDARHAASDLSIGHGWAWIVRLEDGKYTIVCGSTLDYRPECDDVVAEYKDGIEQ